MSTLRAEQTVTAGTMVLWGGDQDFSRSGNTYVPDTSFSIDQIDSYIDITTGSPTDGVRLKIYSGSFTGTLLGTSETQPYTAMGSWVSFTFSTPVAVTEDSTYYIIWERTGAGDNDNRFTLHGYYNGGPDTGYYELAGKTWAKYSTVFNDYTLSYKIYGDPEASVSPLAVNKGLRKGVEVV